MYGSPYIYDMGVGRRYLHSGIAGDIEGDSKANLSNSAKIWFYDRMSFANMRSNLGVLRRQRLSGRTPQVDMKAVSETVFKSQ